LINICQTKIANRLAKYSISNNNLKKTHSIKKYNKLICKAFQLLKFDDFQPLNSHLFAPLDFDF